MISVLFHIVLFFLPLSYPSGLMSHRNFDFIKVNLIEAKKTSKINKMKHQHRKVKGLKTQAKVKKIKKGTKKRTTEVVVKQGKTQKKSVSKIEFVKKSLPIATVIPPKAIFSVKPEYPYIARKRGYEGKVIVRLLIGKDGRVKRLFLVKSSGYKVLDRSALKALKNWRFSPARIAGAPVEYWVEVPVVFRLSGQS